MSTIRIIEVDNEFMRYELLIIKNDEYYGNC